MARGKPWTREELIVAYALYCVIPFSKLNNSNRTIKDNVSRDGKTREQSEAELLEEALGEGFDKRSSGSTILIAGRTPECEIIVLRYGFWLALDLTVQV